jgi:hypothetical protein
MAATTIWRRRGDQLFDNAGKMLEGGKLFYYTAATSNLRTTYSNAAGTIPNTNPVVLDGYGRLQETVYFDDGADYKELLTTSSGATVALWPMDNIPAATPDVVVASFAAPLLTWAQVTSAQSPVALVAADLGKAYECDTTAGNIEFDLPAASLCTNKGFWFKKTATANAIVLDPNGSETIDNSATSISLTAIDTIVGVFSNGAEWYLVASVVTGDNLLRTFNGLTADAAPDPAADYVVTLDASAAFPKKVLLGNIPGNLEFVETGTVTTAATKDFTIPANCDVMEIEFWNWLPATDNVSLFLRFSQAATFLAGASDYKWGGTFAAVADSDAADSEIHLAQVWGNAAGEFGHGTIRIFRPSVAATVKAVRFCIDHHNINGIYIEDSGAGELIANTNAIDGVRLLFSSGNIASGVYTVRYYRNF